MDDARKKTLERKSALIGAAMGVIACKTTTEGGSIGYGVVDPMPPPARCPDLLRMAATARRLPNGNVEITIPAKEPPKTGTGSWIDRGPPAITGGKLVNSSFSADSIVLVVTPASDQLLIQISGGCTTETALNRDTLTVEVSVRDGGVPQVWVYEVR